MEISRIFPENTPEIRLDLTREEAEVLVKLTGAIGGTGPVRDICDIMWDNLRKLGITSSKYRMEGIITSLDH